MDSIQGTIRLGMVGLGGAAIAGHLPLLLKMKDQVQIVALCDKDQETLQTMSRRFGVGKTYRDINEMLRQGKLDAVDICTPPLTHKELCLSALKANVNCIVEKPIVTSVADFDELTAVAGERNLGIFVIHNNSFTPILRKARKLLNSGEIGDILQVDVRFSFAVGEEYNPEHWVYKLPGGIFGEGAPHACGIFAEFLGGEAREIASQMIRRSSSTRLWGDELKVLVRTDKNLGSLSVSLNSPTRKLMVDLIGSKLWVSIDADAQTLVKYKPIPCGQHAIFKRGQRSLSEIFQRVGCLASVTADVATGRYRPSEGHRYLLDQAVKALRGEGAYPVKPEHLREGVKILEAAFSQK